MMAFKTLIRKQSRDIPPRNIRILKSGHIRISRDLSKLIKTKNIKILIDVDYNKFALLPTNDTNHAYVLSRKNKNNCFSIQSSMLSAYAPKGDFKARFTEGKIIIDDIKVHKFKDCNFVEDEE